MEEPSPHNEIELEIFVVEGRSRRHVDYDLQSLCTEAALLAGHKPRMFPEFPAVSNND